MLGGQCCGRLMSCSLVTSKVLQSPDQPVSVDGMLAVCSLDDVQRVQITRQALC